MKNKILLFTRVYYGYVNLGYACLALLFLVYYIFANPIYGVMFYQDVSPVFIVLSTIAGYLRSLLSLVTVAIIGLLVIFAFNNIQPIARLLRINLEIPPFRSKKRPRAG